MSTEQFKRMFFKYFALAVLVVFSPVVALAELSASLDAITPAASLRDGSVPPQAGVTLFVFEGNSFNTSYTAVFDVNEEPASVVVIPAEMEGYAYDGDAGKLTMQFKHVNYVDGVELFGPPTDFSIAVIGAVDQGAEGPPAALRGSRMATNLSPTGWTLEPPDEESPAFGYELTGPASGTAFFQLFIPQTFINFLSDVFDETLTVSDLAVFNEDQQASVTVTEVSEGGSVIGASIDINVTFDEGLNTVDDDDEMALAFPRNQGGQFPGGPPGQESESAVTKSITVSRADNLSLTASSNPAFKRSTVSLFGWARDCTPGDQVEIRSNAVIKKRRKKAKAKGKKKFNKVWKRVSLGSECDYSLNFKAKKADKFQAFLKQESGKLKSSKVKFKLVKK